METNSPGLLSKLSCLLVAIALLVFAGAVGAEVGDEDCIACHTDPAKVRAVIDPKEVSKSVHKGLSCNECHESVTRPDHELNLPDVNCGSCHEDEAKEFSESVHGLAKVQDEDIRPGCKACHGTHSILSKKKPLSTMHPTNVSKTCGHCHSDPRVIGRLNLRGLNPVALYEASVHHQPRKDNPDQLAATCIDCHGSHGIFGPVNPKSTIGKLAVPGTCGKCHQNVNQDYLQSVHWQSLQTHGHYEVPVCNDCHGEHQPSLPGSPDPAQRALASSKLCANCHANSVLMARFGLDARRLSSYMMTYHGLAVLRGDSAAASCTSCHEVHAIRSARDPAASVNPAHLEQTCGKCHADVTYSFATVSVHPVNQRERNPLAYLFRTAYVWIIVLTIGGMLVHNLIIFVYYLRLRWREKRHHTQVRRFSDFQVLQHFLLFLSFSALAVTGFALKFSDSWWAQALTAAGMDEPLRALIHRICGAVLIAISIVQALYFVGWRSGQREIRALIPQVADLVAFWKTMRFYLLLKGSLPPAGRYDYTEKAEYLALIWGTFVMAVTGLILWFPEYFLRYLPVYTFEVSEVIHFYEAILAVLAIVVWHLFFTVFHPEKYPMSLTWLDGKVSTEEQRHHHALEDIQESSKP